MNSSVPLRILVACSHPIVCEGVCSILTQQPDMVVVGRAGNGGDAIELFAQHQPDALVSAWDFPDMDGRNVIATLKARFPDARVLVLSRHDEEETISSALRAGARGYFLHDVRSEKLAEGIRAICAGNIVVDGKIAQKMAEHVSKPELTEREREVLQQVVNGKTNVEIAADLSVAIGTVKSHLNKIFAKLGVNDRTQAVLAALKRGLARLY